MQWENQLPASYYEDPTAEYFGHTWDKKKSEYVDIEDYVERYKDDIDEDDRDSFDSMDLEDQLDFLLSLKR